MKRVAAITIATLLCLTLTGSVAVVVREAPDLTKVRLIEVEGCKVDGDGRNPHAIVRLLPVFC